MNTLWITLIYASGLFTSYYLLRFVSKLRNQWGYGRLITTVLISTLSWITFVFFSLVIIIVKIKDIENNAPPKWL